MAAFYSTYNFKISFVEKGKAGVKTVRLSYSDSPDLVPCYLPKNLGEVLGKVRRDWRGRIEGFVEVVVEIISFQLYN